MLNPGEPSRVPYVTSALAEAPGPVVAVSDWIKAVPDQIARWVPGTFTSLGTDGFGFSDTRPAARRYYNTDGESIAVAVLEGLARDGNIDRSVAVEAANKYKIDDVMAAPEQTSDPGVA
jgi:pyruvate dehydrogenase E1 component